LADEENVKVKGTPVIIRFLILTSKTMVAINCKLALNISEDEIEEITKQIYFIRAK
jgi:hypothetical protein